MGYRQQLKEILCMFVIDRCLYSRIIAHAGTDISVQNGICKAQIILIALSAQTV